MVKPVTFASVALLLLTLLLPHLGTVSSLSVSAQPTLLYSFVHLTDTQTLSERFPKTLNSTFLYLEQVKSEYNIRRIIVTGDLVQHWNRVTEWHNFVSATTLTSIETDCLAGNHDNASGRNFTYYNHYIGADRQFYFKVFDDFLFLYASWPNQANTLNQTILAYFNSILDSYPSKIPIFATHYYSDGHSTGHHHHHHHHHHYHHLSALGQQLLSLTRTPALVLMGHVLGAWIYIRNVRDKPVYEFNTNYQNANRSYVRIFSVYSDATIYVKEIRVEPKPLATASTFMFSYSLTAEPYVQVTFVNTEMRNNAQTTTQKVDLTYAIVGIVATPLIIGLVAGKGLLKHSQSRIL